MKKPERNMKNKKKSFLCNNCKEDIEYKENDFNQARGKHYGYSSCCIKYFIKRKLEEKLKYQKNYDKLKKKIKNEEKLKNECKNKIRMIKHLELYERPKDEILFINSVGGLTVCPKCVKKYKKNIAGLVHIINKNRKCSVPFKISPLFNDLSKIEKIIYNTETGIYRVCNTDSASNNPRDIQKHHLVYEF